MEILLQEFFYPIPPPYNQYETIDSLVEQLSPYFYNNTPPLSTPPLYGIETTISNNCKTNVIKKSTPLSKNVVLQTLKGDDYIPTGCDSLFWSIYQHMLTNLKIHNDGGVSYNAFGGNPLMTQVEEKMRIINWIKEDIKRFQGAINGHRITKGRVQEIMTMLLTGVKNNLDCIMAYAAYYGVTVVIWYPQNHTYCAFSYCGEMVESPVLLRYCGGGGDIKWKLESKVKVDDVYKRCVKMKHYNGEGGTALGSESLYKKEELVNMAILMGVDKFVSSTGVVDNDGGGYLVVDECSDVDKQLISKMSKKELYDKINMLCYIIR